MGKVPPTVSMRKKSKERRKTIPARNERHRRLRPTERQRKRAQLPHRKTRRKWPDLLSFGHLAPFWPGVVTTRRRTRGFRCPDESSRGKNLEEVIFGSVAIPNIFSRLQTSHTHTQTSKAKHTETEEKKIAVRKLTLTQITFFRNNLTVIFTPRTSAFTLAFTHRKRALTHTCSHRRD